MLVAISVYEVFGSLRGKTKLISHQLLVFNVCIKRSGSVEISCIKSYKVSKKNLSTNAYCANSGKQNVGKSIVSDV